MPLSIHDTYSRTKRAFAPADADRVTLYVCGPTVYNFAHIGNARPAVVFDVLFRLLRHAYGADHVVYARNITDVDDKINAAALAQGVPISAITDKFAAIYNADMAALGVLEPTLQPRATAHIDAIVAMIGRLVANASAYAAEGHVLFDTQAFPDYGQLSGRTLEDLIAGARVDVAPYKRHPADFVLWKPSKVGDPVWDSPFGPGRPGWHIECSAMIETTLGLPIDIHGGGHDLIFPHHENEIAQGLCASGQGVDHIETYARYWMHNGFLTMDAEKMSKSLGNVRLVHELIEKIPGEAIRWALLSAHYRAPLDWTDELLEQSKRTLDRLYQSLQDARRETGRSAAQPLADAGLEAQAIQEAQAVAAALEDDLNTPAAMSGLSALATSLRQAVTAKLDDAIVKQRALVVAGGLLGFLQVDPAAWFEGGADEALKTKVDALIAARADARRAKDWTAADRIRVDLADLGVEVLDGPGGTATWRRREERDLVDR
jgi:cysteinyl-tRNA synthetase